MQLFAAQILEVYLECHHVRQHEYARSTWEGRSLNQTTALFEAYLRNGGTGTRCPKVGIGFFYYASIQRSIRGAVALDNVH